MKDASYILTGSIRAKSMSTQDFADILQGVWDSGACTGFYQVGSSISGGSTATDTFFPITIKRYVGEDLEYIQQFIDKSCDNDIRQQAADAACKQFLLEFAEGLEMTPEVSERLGHQVLESLEQSLDLAFGHEDITEALNTVDPEVEAEGAPESTANGVSGPVLDDQPWVKEGLKEEGCKSSGQKYGFVGLAVRQRLIKRWALRHCISEENVLEHVGMVTTLSLLAGYISRQQGTPINLELVLAHSALHDSPETLTQDVISPVKNASPELAEAYRKLEQKAISNMLGMVPEEIRDDVTEAFQLADGYEYRIFKACDTYAAYIKCRLEVAYGNGIEFSKALVRQEEKIQEFCEELPPIAALHEWFGDGIDMPLDDLLGMICPEHPVYPLSV